MVRQAALSIRIPETLKQAIDKAAAKDHRTTTSLVEKILADWLREQASQEQGGELDASDLWRIAKGSKYAPSKKAFVAGVNKVARKHRHARKTR